MSESEAQQEQQEQEERELKDPRDLKKRPRSWGKAAPDHVRVKELGARTTARTNARVAPGENLLTETQIEAHKEVEAEDYKRTEARATSAGPNPYDLPPTALRKKDKRIKELQKERDENELHNSLLEDRALGAHAAATGESDANAVDAEVQVVGATLTDTGQKIVAKPDRVAADEKAVLRVAGTPHEEAIEVSDDPLRADANPGPGAQPIHRDE
jgi:hypothetical protein